MEYYLSLGSNMGDRMGFLRRALDYLKKRGTLQKISSVYETSPVEVEDSQSMYLNMVVLFVSDSEPEELLNNIKEFEKRSGRNREYSHLKPREIDIDILFCGNLILNGENLTIPHPGVKRRKFVLIPMMEITPEFRYPGSGKPLETILKECNDDGVVRLYKKKQELKI